MSDLTWEVSDLFFISFNEEDSSAKILNFDDDSNTLYSCSQFAYTTLKLLNAEKQSRSKLIEKLQIIYEGSIGEQQEELTKVLSRFENIGVLISSK